MLQRQQHIFFWETFSIAVEHIIKSFNSKETIGNKNDAIEWLRNVVKEINNKINELQIMSLSDLMHDNKENIKIYNDVIKGLEDML